MTWTGELSAMEERADTDSLDDLHDRRRKLLTANARLIALHGPFGHYDDHRKRMVEAQKIAARMALTTPEGKKPTEAQIDAEAYGSDAYQTFLDTALSEKIEYLDVQNQIDELNDRIRNREIALSVYGKEISLR